MSASVGVHPQHILAAAQTAGPVAIAPELQCIFAERARRLAQPLRHTDDDGDHQVLVFAVGGERYALDSRLVIEVHPVGRISPVPGTAAIWMGVVNLRGRLYAVLELGRLLAQLRLHRATDASRHGGQLVLAAAAGVTVALFVDEVLSVRRMTQRELLPPLAESQQEDRRSVLGITDDLVVLLDLASLLQQVQPDAQPSAQLNAQLDVQLGVHL